MGPVWQIMGLMVADPATAIAIEVTRIVDAVLAALDFKPIEKQARLSRHGHRGHIVHGDVFSHRLLGFRSPADQHALAALLELVQAIGITKVDTGHR